MSTAVKKAFSRRMFLKSAPAAPLAASTIAADVAAKGLGPGMPPGVYSAGAMTANMPANMPDVDTSWFATRTAELKAAADGQLSEEDEMYLKPRADMVRAYHYDSLRSLSPTMRARLHADAVSRAEREQRKSWALLELNRFLKNAPKGFF